MLLQCILQRSLEDATSWRKILYPCWSRCVLFWVKPFVAVGVRNNFRSLANVLIRAGPYCIIVHQPLKSQDFCRTAVIEKAFDFNIWLMGTIFRFAIQTRDRRLSEVWSFFANKGEGCLYATRTSMTQWLKVSFHQTGMSHIKTYDSESRPRGGTRSTSWTYSEDEIVADEDKRIIAANRLNGRQWVYFTIT